MYFSRTNCKMEHAGKTKCLRLIFVQKCFKTYLKIKYVTYCCFFLCFSGCYRSILDFGFDVNVPFVQKASARTLLDLIDESVFVSFGFQYLNSNFRTNLAEIVSYDLIFLKNGKKGSF